jgi:hypothetical protein
MGMTRSRLAGAFVIAAVVGVGHLASVSGQSLDMSGRWALNRSLSQLPREMGFSTNWVPATDEPGQGASQGRGRRTSGGTNPFAAQPESEDDANRRQQLTSEARNPFVLLAIVDTPSSVTLTNERGQSRAFHTDGREDVVQLAGVPVAAIAKRDAGRFVIRYEVEPGRELRYTLSRNASPAQLVVEVEFWERGATVAGDRARRVYEPAGAETVSVESPVSAAERQDTKPPTATAPVTAPANAPPVPSSAPQTFNQRPGAELKGLRDIGLVVEELDPQASGCGLSQSAIETALLKRLSDAGFRVRRNSDEDTYLYVNIETRSLSTGLCVSRYDVFLYTHTTAKLSYQETPVLVQVSLLHRGGLAGGSAAPHADGVIRGLQDYVDQFSARIRAANN